MQSVKEHLDHGAPENSRRYEQIVLGKAGASEAELQPPDGCLTQSWLAEQLRTTAGFLEGVREKHVEFGRIKNAPNSSLVKTGVGDGDGDSCPPSSPADRGRCAYPRV